MEASENKKEVSRCMRIIQAITVEPILFLYMLGGSFQWPTVDALIYRKVCLGNFNLTVCDNLHRVEFSEHEDVVQTITSHWYLVNNLCFELPAIFTSLFYGNLSDHFSRKTALILPLVGQMITLSIYITNSIFMDWPVPAILIGPLLSGMFGGWIACCLSCYSYISDVSSEENRSIRIGIGEAMSAMSISTGFFLSGFTLDHTSFAFTLAVSFCMYMSAFLYANFYVKDLNNCDNNNDNNDTHSIGHIIKTVCSPSKVKDAVYVVFQKRSGNTRTYIIILLFGMSSAVLTGSASWIIGYLFLRRQPLSWTQSLYGYYVGFGALLKGLTLIIVMPILKKKLKMRDTSILIAVTFLDAASETLFGFSKTTWMVFFVPVVGFLHEGRATCTRALLSNLVGKHELGKMFAVVGSLQSGSEVMASFIYNNTYPLTLKIWPGICFVAGAAFTFIPIALFAWVRRDMKKPSEYDPIVTEVSSEDEDAAKDDRGQTNSVESNLGEEMKNMAQRNGVSNHIAHDMGDEEETTALL